MKLTIHLLRDSRVDLDGIILPKYLEGDGYVEVRPTAKLPFACRAWLRQNKAKRPGWLEWLATSFDIEQKDLVNQSNSCILGLEVAGRQFAVTFGYGFSVIDRALVEPDFGLKVTLSIVDPTALDMVDTRTLERVTKQTRIHLSVGRPVEEFGIEPDLDWLRAVRGTASCEQITGKVQGSDAVRISWNGSLESVGGCCQRLLEIYQSQDYRRYFGFVDHLRRLPKDDPLVAVLEDEVRGLLKRHDRERLTVAHPEIPSPDIETFKIWSGNTRVEDVDELDLDAVFSFLDRYEQMNGEQADPHKSWVIALDGRGEARSQKTALWKYLTAHVEHDDHIYVLSLGQWFRTDKDYLDTLRRKVAAIHDISADLNCHPWPKGMSERNYNALLATSQDWLLLDRSMFTFGGARSKIECADLLTPNGDFLHVKCSTSSANLSHLFAQGTVSARLFRTDPEYRAKVAQAFHEKYGEQLNEDSVRVVYAIGTERDGPIAEILFFFSMVNLVQHRELLEAMRLPVAVCRIKRQGALQSPGVEPLVLSRGDKTTVAPEAVGS